MKIDVVLNPAEIALLPQRDLSRATCVVFDVLRATSSMITALAHGAAAVYPACTIEEAFALRAAMPDAVLGGERHGELIPGFDVGNAPHEYLGFEGRRIISTTTNGTIALRACENAERVLVGALLNLDAVAAAVERHPPTELVLVAAGTFAEFALEDAFAAGLLLRKFRSEELSDAATAAHALTPAFNQPIDALRAAKNGRVLSGKGRAAEVEWCARLSVFNVVGMMEQAVIRPLTT
jgi:2-phosphosulfolactate phosphatase